jgi:phage tail-like protein
MTEFIPFRFDVKLYKDDAKDPLCEGKFSEISGLELTMEPRAIQVGGQNWGEVQRVGQTTFSPIVLKRGVTQLNDLYDWFDLTTRSGSYGYKLQGQIDVKSSEADKKGNAKVVMTWALSGVMPTRFKGPDLSSVANQVAIEELTLVTESLILRRPGGSNA